MDYKDKLKLAKEALDSGSYDKETIEYIFPELKESEDERIRKELIEFVKSRGGFKQEYIAWLKKQSEQKLADEPKFKVGDWVVSPNGIYWHIDAIQNGRYEVTADTGQCSNWPLDTNIYRLWTIQDAKDSDVLAEDTCTFIIKKLNDDLSAEIYCCLYDDGDFEINSKLVFDDTCTYPATKEQRDLLFQKIKEAGYEWDAENLQLTKILPVKDLSDGINIDKQKSAAWSEDDEHRIELLKALCEDKLLESVPNSTMYGEMKTTIDWLQSLRPQSKQEWSEEDEKMLDYALDMIEWYSGKDEDKSRLVSDWLKSLRPQLKHGWSEEDDWIKTKIIKVLLSYETFLNPKETNECIDWLKSLKQRIGG